jgi:hypothetical protein
MSDKSEPGKDEALGLLVLVAIGLIWWAYSSITAPDVTLEIAEPHCSTTLSPGTWSFPKGIEFKEDDGNDDCILVDAVYTDSTGGEVTLKDNQVFADAHFLRSEDGATLGSNTVRIPGGMPSSGGKTGVVKICAKDDLIEDASEDITVQLKVRCHWEFLCEKACSNRWDTLQKHLDTQSEESDSSLGRLLGAVGSIAARVKGLTGASTENCTRSCRQGEESSARDKARALAVCLTKAKTYDQLESCEK